MRKKIGKGISIGIMLGLLLFPVCSTARELLPSSISSSNDYNFGDSTVRIYYYIGNDRVKTEYSLKEGEGSLELDYGIRWGNEYNQIFTEGAKQYSQEETMKVEWDHKGSLFAIQSQITYGMDGIQRYAEGWGTNGVMWKK